MTIQEMKKAAFAAAKYENITADQYLSEMNVQESLYYMRMVYYYRLFDAGKIKVTEAKRVEQRILADFNRLDNALRLSQKNYKRQVHMALDCEMERTKLVKQLRAGDREFIVTLLNLLDLYTGEDIYARLYQIMQPPLTDADMDDMIAACPEEYRRGMTADEARTAVWQVIRHLNGDSEIAATVEDARISNA